MSSLSQQAAAFRKTLKEQPVIQAARISKPVPPTTSPTRFPSAAPSPPNIDAVGTPRKKPKTTIVYSQPADTGVGTHLLSHLHYAVEYLKKCETPRSIHEVMTHLNIPYTQSFSDLLRKNDRIMYDPNADTYMFKPLHNIRTPATLLAYLNAMPTARGMPVKELKEGWKTAIEEIETLEKQGELLVLRSGVPRMIWPNDKDCNVVIEDEFKTIWHTLPIPPPNELPAALEKAGLKPTSVDPATIRRAAVEPKQKKPKRRRGKETNVHLDLLRDYSK